MKANVDSVDRPGRIPTPHPSLTTAPGRSTGIPAHRVPLQALADESPGVQAQSRLQARVDNSPRMIAQRKRLAGLLGGTEHTPAKQAPFVAQKMDDDELQGKFITQKMDDDELQGKFVTQQKPDAAANRTGMPEAVKSKMEHAFQADFSDVTVHANSSRAPALGALAYTQGTDVHFAPGQFKPDAASGQELLGHELAHVVQQSEGRVRPTTDVGGLPVNDSPALEQEADTLGRQAVTAAPAQAAPDHEQD